MRKPRRQAPLRGKVRWLRPLVLPLGFGRLAVTSVGVTGRATTTEYDVEAVLGPGQEVRGLTFFKDNDDRYTVEIKGDELRCECRDYLHRREHKDPNGCKHCIAARIVLRTARREEAAR